MTAKRRIPNPAKSAARVIWVKGQAPLKRRRSVLLLKWKVVNPPWLVERRRMQRWIHETFPESRT